MTGWTLAEYHEQEEIFKLRLGHPQKVREAYAGHFILPGGCGKLCFTFLIKEGKTYREKGPKFKTLDQKERGA